VLKELKFVQGAVARKDLLPALSHFAIEGGTVRGYNGIIALSAPIALDIACKPKAEPMVRAIGNCDDTVSLSLTAGGRLSIKSGKFKAFIDCVEGETPHVMPTGQHVPINGEHLFAAVKVLSEFIGEDAARPWSNGILLRGVSAYATNNITLVEYWIGSEFPLTVCLPRMAVREMLRINEAPEGMQADEHSVTFFYSGNRWLRTQLLSTEWPDLGSVLDKGDPFAPTVEEVDTSLFEGLAVVKPFADKLGRAILKEGVLRTHVAEGEGSLYDLTTLRANGVFNVDMLQLLQGVAQKWDLSTYPRPCFFYGDRLRGAIIGMRE